MKNGQNLREMQQKKKESEEEQWVKPQPCHICGKELKGAYGFTNLAVGVVWSCSGQCEKQVAQLRKEFYAGPHAEPHVGS